MRKRIQALLIIALSVMTAVFLSACGGDGVCGKCKVILRSGEVISPPAAAIKHQEREKRVFLACLTCAASDLEIEIPESSRQDFEVFSK